MRLTRGHWTGLPSRSVIEANPALDASFFRVFELSYNKPQSEFASLLDIG